MQVELLKTCLPEGSKVGTIDKFQGQEAEVVIVSMTTSGPEEIGRDANFLFSKNRLNVALTRAKCLAIVLFSARLLTFPCRTPEQINLLNTFAGCSSVMPLKMKHRKTISVLTVYEFARKAAN